MIGINSLNFPPTAASLATKPALAVPEYHQSSINMFLRCQRQYMFRYMMNLRIPPKAALTVGRAFDTSVSYNMTQKIESKVDVPVDEVADAFSTSFDKESAGTDWSEDDPGEQKDMGVKMARAFHEKAAPAIQPVSVQEAFRLETDAGYALGGTFDVVQEGHILRDQKTSAKAYSENAVQTEVQPALYSFAYKAKHGEHPDFAYDVVTKHKGGPRYQEVKGRVTQTQFEQLFEVVTLMHSAITRGEFQYATPGSWQCSPKWCAYWDRCKGKK